MRSFFLALLAVFALTLVGCGDSKPPAPPAGADAAETPTLDIEEGIEMPGETAPSQDATSSDDAKKKAEK